MENKITPKIIFFKGYSTWVSKIQGVIFVNDENDAKALFKMLCEQDDYWEHYEHLIKVLPEDFQIESEDQLKKFCHYCGKTDIYDVESLREKIDFIIYQYYENECQY